MRSPRHGGTLAPGQGEFGVFERPVELEDDGYPRTAVVRLHDDSAAVVVVPYRSLFPLPAGMKVR